MDGSTGTVMEPVVMGRGALSDAIVSAVDAGRKTTSDIARHIGTTTASVQSTIVRLFREGRVSRTKIIQDGNMFYEYAPPLVERRAPRQKAQIVARAAPRSPEGIIGIPAPTTSTVPLALTEVTAAPATPVGRGPGRPFVKGQSGNPGGRPPLPDGLRLKLRDAAPGAIDRLIALMGSSDERIALEACTRVAHRAYGKRALAIDVPEDWADRVRELENELFRRAISGDMQALALALRVADPARFGGEETTPT